MPVRIDPELVELWKAIEQQGVELATAGLEVLDREWERAKVAERDG